MHALHPTEPTSLLPLAWGPDVRTARVTKTLRPGAGGTKRLLRRHAAALVCARYRRDALGICRYTTVELVVDVQPVDAARFPSLQVGLRLDPHDRAQRRLVMAAGGRWDPRAKLWWMGAEAALRARAMALAVEVR